MDESKKKIIRPLARLVRQRRTALGISQEELGVRANLDRTYISGVERGLRNPSLTALVSLASGLGITASNLLNNLEIEAEPSSEQQQFSSPNSSATSNSSNTTESL